MERIQKLFELLAGISAEENARLARAKVIFADNSMDISALQIPACWRRKPAHRSSLTSTTAAAA